ncbi:chromosome segregation protein SMC [Oceanispirochaeta crateris]|uniref:Chromosome partition protein Smc n=1 Tax=Oceanispirochaeta crateris TaxID=2518645 RepID=A0A5C1QJ85_9SPIO|nr:AAA family ATPase [Oceanispirochaeta crateris]QEN07527.1 chromosome segregation protein SMC [Oceanispirochaeta crateris]
MFLKRIEIMGFKSFADRTHIDFTDGITALLGPNGCGKSNIVDAMKWVLGEQSTKNMRAEKMEDVIFNGTDERKALNVAEVTLIISNEENLLDLDLSEISIKRRLYRNGDSEYFVNNTLVKLKELRELFYDTGIGKSAYSIMEQGKIDQVLSNKPEERRYLFEEAAGITRFKMKGSEAERKLNKTNENMVQVENILSEVKKNYETLKKQSDKTLIYRQLREEISSIDIDLQLLKYNQLVSQLQSKEKILNKELENKGKIVEEINSLNGNLASNLDEVNSMENELIEDQKRLYGLDLEKENLSDRIKFLGEQLGELENQKQTLKQKELDFLDKKEGFKKEEVNRKNSLQEFKDQLKDIENNILNFQKNIKSAEIGIDENSRIIKETESRIVQGEKDRETLQHKLRDLTDNIVHQLDQGLKNSGFSIKKKKELEEKVISQLKAVQIQLEGKIRLFDDSSRVGHGKDDSEIWDSGVLILREFQKNLSVLEESIHNLADSLPDFLEEFLAPSGIISKKRDIDDNIEKLALSLKNDRDSVKTKTDESMKLNIRIQEYRNTLEELRVNKARMATQITAIEDNIQVLSREIMELEEQIRNNLEEINHVEARKMETQKKIDESGILLKNHDVSKKDLLLKLKKLEKSIQNRTKDVSGKEGELKKKNADLQKLILNLEKVNLEIEHINTDLQELKQNFRENNSADIMSFIERIPFLNTNRQDLKSDYSAAREKLRALGQVNLMAPEEFSEVKERYDFLNKQLEDLRTAKEHLIQVTNEIRKESAHLFQKTYQEIKKNFNETFRRMFGGGRAELKLVDPENILESGIEIYAQPPGKKLENIALLSGGERSLTGVALLFATYKVKPSPFCILDEIDAALDEANIQRFINVLMDFGERSQFIVITHNKKTVTGAKTLLGITMQESGVSKLIAMKIGEANETR